MIEQKQIIDIMMRALDDALSNVHTVTIAKVTTVNGTTIDCQPVINRVVDGKSVQLPEFIEVPPIFMQGGGSYIALPVSVGDYCVLLFTERCYDRWYDGQDFQSPLELRMHDYSDGLAIVGIKPMAGAITIPTLIHVEGDSEQIGNFELTGNLTVNGDIVTTGAVDADGEVTAKASGGSVGLSTHQHTGSNSGTPTSPPTAGT